MPTLPTFNVTDSVAQRLMAAFSGQTDENGTTLTAAQAYRRWLRASLVAHVLGYESEANRTPLTNDLPM